MTSSEDPNQQIAIQILDLAEVYRPSPRYWGYKQASRAIRRHPQFVTELTDAELLKIPGVGPATVRVVREILNDGRSATVERAIAASGKAREIEQRAPLRQNFLSAAMVEKVLREPKRGAVKREEYGGDFQMHSRGSDGSDTVAQLARACMKRGYRCMAVTDHSYGLPIAGGMSREEMRAQRAEVTALNRKFGSEFRVFHGVEANILIDGRLDMQPEELKKHAAELGLDASAFGTCLDSLKYGERVRNGVAEGTRLGVNSTPTIYVNGRMLSGAQPYEVFVSVIDEELSRGK